MRQAQVYRWQVPMDAGVVLRERRLKTRDGLFIHLQDGERQGWGEIAPLPGFSAETLEEAQSALVAWACLAAGREPARAVSAFRGLRRQLCAGGAER
jgi:O-succinylbenzoate synthase